MIADDRTLRGRLVAALAAVGLQLLIGWMLISGLAADFTQKVVDTIAVFEVAPEPPPPPEKIVPKRVRQVRPAGRASAANLKAKAAPIVAPPVVIPPAKPPPVAAALLPGIDSDADAGAATTPGPGSGAGGAGTGTGSGAAGDGDGGGTPSRWIGGRIRESDYPRAAFAARAEGTVYVRFIVGVGGRITDCKVTRSSGNEDLDIGTCALMKQRLRYRAARDAFGKKVPEVWTGEHSWELTPGVDPAER
ncbi:TonB family protein [Glacieibacterium sp.]|uniref:TonB family protein n=1 Tax=Glacieibacterium sp. TaxID=2860237 RepID=UPI003AFF8C44